MKSIGPIGFVGVLGLVGFGCARNAEEKQLDAMRDEIDNIRETRDRADGNQPGRDSAEPSMVVPPAYKAAGGPRPPLSVIQLGANDEALADNGSDGDGEAGDPQDTSPRPVIRVSGSARSGGRGGWRGDEVVEETTPDESGSGATPAGPSTKIDPEAKHAYDAAMSLVNAKRYGDALEAFARFLVKWPDHPYANNAMFWRGECYFARGDYPHAVEQFEGVLARFPAGSKAPDAWLKLGMSQQKLGNSMKARECFDRLAKQFPESEAAHHIPGAAAASAPSGTAGGGKP